MTRSTRSLPNFTVGFVYNEPCPLKCDFCCHTKENVGPGRLTPANVTPAALAYAKIESVTRFAFTGGDPFIYIRDIIQIMAELRRAAVGQPFHIVTSGYWAKSDQVTRSLLSQLSELGMDRLYVSYDLEHKKWVSEEFVYRIERACEEFGVLLCVYGVFWEPGVGPRDLLPRLRTSNVDSSLVAPVGRARDNPKLMPPAEIDRVSKFTCGRPQDYDLTVYPNGDTYPCCSGGFNKDAKLLLGNSFKDDPEDLLFNCLSNFGAIIAKEIGFDKLYEELEADGINLPDIPKFDDVHSVCEICAAINGNSAVRHSVKGVFERMKSAYCVERFEEIVRTSSDVTSTVQQS